MRPVQIDPSDPMVIAYTSGSTGIPKGAVRSFQSHNAFHAITAKEFGFSEKDYSLMVMPVFHINSIVFGLTTLAVGGSVYVYRSTGYDAREFLEVMQDERITFTSLVPAHYYDMLKCNPGDYDLSSVQKMLCSSAPVTTQMKTEIMRFLRNAGLYEAYGLTEGGMGSLLSPHEQFTHPSSIGKPCLETEVLVLDDEGQPVENGKIGRLYLRSPMTFTHYLGLPEETEEAIRKDGFIWTGDMATQDDQGYLYFKGRKGDIINSGGEKISPIGAEGVISELPYVDTVVVIGLYHPRWGEGVTAVIVPKEGYTPSSEEVITAVKRSHLPNHEAPQGVITITKDQLKWVPATKKLNRAALREDMGLKFPEFYTDQR